MRSKNAPNPQLVTMPNICNKDTDAHSNLDRNFPIHICSQEPVIWSHSNIDPVIAEEVAGDVLGVCTGYQYKDKNEETILDTEHHDQDNTFPARNSNLVESKW